VSTSSESPEDIWTIRRVLTWSADDLRKRGSTSPRLDAELLLGRVLKLDRVGLLLDSERPLARPELTAYRALHSRRRSGEPVAYLLGVREFYGRPFRVDRRVLIPRPDTETLVEVALARTTAVSLCARVLDLCTGSGCVALSLARERPTTTVLGADLSADALVVAVENMIRLGAVNSGFVRSDLFAALPRGARFDLITANPPYIAAAEIPTLTVDIRGFEPHLALEGGADGLDVMRRLVAEAPSHLAEGGVLAVEMGCDQGDATRALFAAAGFRDIQTRRDYGGLERVISGIRP
jgi:release factor glutamine methyltransferase